MSISSEISRIQTNVNNAIEAIGSTGVSIPDNANSNDLPSLIMELANEKQDKLTGAQGQIVGFDLSGNAIAQEAPDTGVTTFNNRTGAVTPQTGDYTADMVGARPDTWTPTADDVGAIPASQKGAASGVAELDSTGRVPVAQLPSYVDDVVEYASRTAFPATGESGKIYVALDTNLTYRWGGTEYVEISPSLALGETEDTAYRGDRGKTAYDHSQTTGNPHGTTAAEVGAMTEASGDARYIKLDGGAIAEIDESIGDGPYTITFDEETDSGGGGSGGVASFNGRTGAVTPQSGDYTAAMVGAVGLTGGESSQFAFSCDDWQIHTQYENQGIWISEPEDTVWIYASTIAVTGTLDMSNYPIDNLPPPTGPQQAVNKHYVDNLVGNVNTLLDDINGEVV